MLRCLVIVVEDKGYCNGFDCLNIVMLATKRNLEIYMICLCSLLLIVAAFVVALLFVRIEIEIALQENYESVLL